MKFFAAVAAGDVRDTFFTPRVIQAIEARGTLRFSSGPKDQPPDHAALLAQIGDADVLFTGWGTARVDEDVLRAAPNLKYHVHMGGSVANLVCREEYERGVVVLSGNDFFAQSVAEGCLAYTLAALRRIGEYWQAVRTGGWMPEHPYTRGLIGKKVGLVSYGAITAYYARMLRGFDVDLRIASRSISEEELQRVGARRASVEEVFAECDVISLHTALNAQTVGMITRGHLQRIRDGALLVNTARAGLIEREAFYDELSTGRFGAVLDVYYTEPLPQDDPLRSMPNVMLMPHVAGPAVDLRESIALRLIDDLWAVMRGEACRSRIPYEYAARMTV